MSSKNKISKSQRTKRISAAVASVASLATALSACTAQIPNSFRLAQVDESFATNQQINTKIDLLWVVDNSASMDVNQQKLRDGFAGFAQKYLQPTWDIHLAVITTDTYLANSKFNAYLNTVIPGTIGWKSNYIFSRISSFQNPSWNTSLVNTSTGVFTNGLKYNELWPALQSNYGQLLAGKHDGPAPALCSEILPYFKDGQTKCAIRDDQTAYSGTSHCLSPSSGETSDTQCVNTLENDTVRSGKAILTTQPPAGVAADANWTNQLVKDFTVNATTGSAGAGSERGLGSVLELLADNESTATAFFRKGALRGLIFVSDEDDQTMVLPSTVPAGFNPNTYYACDQSGLVARNPGKNITGSYCCSGASCAFGSAGLTCPSKTVDGLTYTISTCPRSDLLMPVSDVKSQLDTFFTTLDGTTTPNYFVTSIVAQTAQTIQTLQTSRNQDDADAGQVNTVAVDRGDRYIDLGNQVGNGSQAYDIGSSDYSVLLDSIGQAIINRLSTYTLARAPTSTEEMIVKITHVDGSSTVVGSDQFVINGKNLIFTNTDFVLSLRSTDKLSVNYQPKTVL